MLSTYIEALPQLVNPRYGTGAHLLQPGRYGHRAALLDEPQPAEHPGPRPSRGARFGEAFVPSDGDRLLLSADYSQVELRLMAHLSGDEAHDRGFLATARTFIRATAAKPVRRTARSRSRREQRRRAKTANFGIIYGISAFGLAQRLGNITMGRGEGRIIDGYFATYPRRNAATSTG